MAQISPTQSRQLGYLAARPMPPMAHMALTVVVMMVKWEERRRTRKALLQLDDHRLDDIGLTRDEAQAEARRPFWR